MVSLFRVECEVKLGSLLERPPPPAVFDAGHSCGRETLHRISTYANAVLVDTVSSATLVLVVKDAGAQHALWIATAAIIFGNGDEPVTALSAALHVTRATPAEAATSKAQ